MFADIEMPPSKTTCTVPQNQPIYQALRDKSAAYPPDKHYQAKAYMKAAETILTLTRNLYDGGDFYADDLPGIGEKIEDFINDFIENTPEPVATVSEPVKTCVVPQNQPIYQALLNKAATYTGEMIYLQRVWKAVADAVANYNRNLYDGNCFCAEELPVTGYTIGTNVENFINDLLDNPHLKPVVKPAAPAITPENPRRSNRIAKMPKMTYFSPEDEMMDVADAMQEVCKKKGWKYTDELVTDFYQWLPTANKYFVNKYDWKTNEYVPLTNIQIAKDWLVAFSTTINQQKILNNITKALIKYCDKKGFEYSTNMRDKFIEWYNDPANKSIVTNTFDAGKCGCGKCRDASTYTFPRSYTYCINKWIATLKKSIVL